MDVTYHIYWGSQTTHTGAVSVLGRFWPGAYSDMFKARVRGEGYVALSTIASNGVAKMKLLRMLLTQQDRKSVV